MKFEDWMIANREWLKEQHHANAARGVYGENSTFFIVEKILETRLEEIDEADRTLVDAKTFTRVRRALGISYGKGLPPGCKRGARKATVERAQVMAALNGGLTEEEKRAAYHKAESGVLRVLDWARPFVQAWKKELPWATEEVMFAALHAEMDEGDGMAKLQMAVTRVVLAKTEESRLARIEAVKF